MEEVPYIVKNIKIDHKHQDVRFKDSNKPKGLVISIDRSDYIEPIEGAVIFDNTDITDSKTIDKVRSVLNNRLAHSVISDMVNEPK